MYYSSLTLAVLAAPLALAQQSLYGQCGGIGWAGDTTCASGSSCVVVNPYYSQCQPGAAATSTLITSTRATTTSARITTTTAATRSTTRTTPSTTVSGGAGPGATLQSGYYWIRAVESPYFHEYLQSSPQRSAGTAVLDAPATAGQFNIVDGQLVQLLDTKGTLLYASVSSKADTSISTNALPVTFSATKNTYGTFAFQGDTTTWSVAGIARPNVGAWYVCAGRLYVNLGNYAYMTPAGCADATIHSYGGATATE